MGKHIQKEFRNLDEVTENGTFEQILIYHLLNYPTCIDRIEKQREEVIEALYKRKSLIQKDLESIVETIRTQKIKSNKLFSKKEVITYKVNTIYDKLKIVFSDETIEFLSRLENAKNLEYFVPNEENNYTRLSNYYNQFFNAIKEINGFLNHNQPFKKYKDLEPKLSFIINPSKERYINLSVTTLKNLSKRSLSAMRFKPIYVITKNFKSSEKIASKLTRKIIEKKIEWLEYQEKVKKNKNIDSIKTYLWNNHRELLKEYGERRAIELVTDSEYEKTISPYSIEIKDLAGLAIVSLELKRDDEKDFNSILLKKITSMDKENKKGKLKIGEIRDYLKNPFHNGSFLYSHAVHVTKIRPREDYNRNEEGQINFLELQLLSIIPFLEYEIGHGKKLSHINYDLRQKQFENNLTQKLLKTYNFYKSEIKVILDRVEEHEYYLK